jgi:hypothetical protein
MAGLDPATHQLNKLHSRADTRAMGGWLEASYDSLV